MPWSCYIIFGAADSRHHSLTELMELAFVDDPTELDRVGVVDSTSSENPKNHLVGGDWNMTGTLA